MQDNRTIRHATLNDIDDIMAVLAVAREKMRRSGNLTSGLMATPPSKPSLPTSSATEDCGYIVAYFAFLPSPEPTYASIYDGEWLDDTLPYHVVHRMGSLDTVHGIFNDVVDYCFSCVTNLRIDTHRDNKIMRNLLLEHGFHYCGIIYLQGGDERLAYQRLTINSRNI